MYGVYRLSALFLMFMGLSPAAIRLLPAAFNMVFCFFLCRLKEFDYLCRHKNRYKSMTTEHLYFITFCVGSLSEALHKSAAQVYSALRSSGVLNEYIIPCYDVLHTFSKEYIVQDLTEVLKEKGALA
jgi:hypothetical protein